jgi:luciferase family oxidoreductase group 1
MTGLAKVRLSVLDTSPIVAGSSPRAALTNSLDLARLAERLGYHRYWVAEHHSMRGVGTSAPAVVIARLAAATERIRLGSGGVLLPNHPPIVIAEQFATLEAFFPGRIDLGLGRALGGNKRAVAAVRPEQERTAKPFAEQLGELLEFLHPAAGAKVRAVPAASGAPPVWLLGSSGHSAALAGELGLGYAFAHHLNPSAMTEALTAYRASFRPSQGLEQPSVLVSVSVIAGESDDQAEWLAGPSKLKYLSRRLGNRIQLPTPGEAADFAYTDEHLAAIETKFADVVIGGPDRVAKALAQLLDGSGAEELMVSTQVYDHPDRRRSYELVAAARDQH